MSARDISREKFSGYGIEARPVTPSDLPSLRRWRNSREISEQMLDQSHISPRKQVLWYEGIMERSDQAHWVVWCKGVRAGYMNVKGDGRLREQEQVYVGAYVGDSAAKHGLLGLAISLMQLDIAFETLTVSRVRISVKESNASALRFNREMGYREERREEGLVHMAISRADYKAAKAKMTRYFRGA